VADERICYFRVDTLEKTVLEMELMLVTRRVFSERPFGGEWKQFLAQTMYLVLKTKVKRPTRTTCPPVLLFQRFETGHRKIEVGGGHTHTNPRLNSLE
jgi:hypothetical protein